MENHPNSYISKITPLISNVLDQDLYKSLQTSTTDEFISNYSLKIYTDLPKDYQTIIRYFCFSFLTGEYLCIRDYIKNITNIKEEVKKLKSINIKDTDERDDVFIKINNVVIHQFKRPIIATCDYICIKVTHIIHSLSDKSHDIIAHRIDKDLEDNLDIHEHIEKDTSEQIQLLEYCILLSMIDHQLSYSDNIFEKLLEIHDYIINTDEYKNNDILFNILLDKCNVILLKLHHLSKRENIHNFLLKNFIEEELSIDDFKTEYYCSIWEKTQLYYPITNDDKEAFKKCAKKAHKDPNLSQYEKFFLLTHLYKNIKKKEKKIIEIIEELDSLSYPNEDSFNESALLITKNYISNNLFSFQLQKDKFDFTKTEDYFKKLENRHKEDNCDSYYPFYKYLKILDAQVEKTDDTKLLKKLLKRQKELLSTLREKYSTFTKKKKLIFQLPFDECLTEKQDIDGEERQLFLASSFILPINHKNEAKEIRAISDNLYEKYLVQITTRSESLEHKLEKAIKDIDKNNTRNIELISIFTAVIAITVGGLSTISIENKIDAVLTFLAFSSGICLFISLIIVLTRSVANGIWNKICSGFIIALTIISMFYAISYLNANHNPEQKKTNKQISKQDSISKKESIYKHQNNIN